MAEEQSTREHGRSIVWRYDLLAAGVAILVSLLALGVSAYSTYWLRQQTRAQVWPRLELWTSNMPTTRFSISNSGVGPALIRTIAVELDGKPVKTWSEIINQLGAADGKVNYNSRTSYLHGRVLRAGADVDALEIQEKTVGDKVLAAHDRIDIRICYCNVLEECWKISQGHASEQLRSASCDGEPNSFEQ
jgi:hypothetical protein